MSTWNQKPTRKVLAEVLYERERQHEQWGIQTHRNHVWLAILMEEVGEAAKGCLEMSGLRDELIHVAAVAVAAIEDLDRG